MFTDVLSVAKFIMNVGIGTYVGITLCRCMSKDRGRAAVNGYGRR